MDPIHIALVVRTSERLTELSRKSFADLSLLPDHEGYEVRHGEKQLSVSVWHDILESGEHRIVVQTTNPRWLGMWAWVHADGFAITPNGEKRSLTEEELAPFR